MSIASEEEHSLYSNGPVGSNYSKSNDDPFTFRANQISTKKRVRRGEHSPAYNVFTEHDLLISAFRKERFSDIFIDEDLVPNSTMAQNFAKRWRWGVYFTPGCGLFIYKLFNKEIVVPPGHISCFTDEDNNYIFAKPGIHNIQDPFLKQVSNPIPINGAENQRNVIEHGNRTVVTVPQGMLGIATDMGQLILLPPGLHGWKSETIRFDRMHKLDDLPVLQIGPYTIVTVDEGYAAVTMNNGKQVLLEGGRTHLLTHQKWRFEKFMNLKIQSDDLNDFEVTTAEKLKVSLNATITWKITTAEKAALIMTETDTKSDISIETDENDDLESLGQLRHQVIAQTMSGLAFFIASVQYSDHFMATSTKGSDDALSSSVNRDTLFDTLFDEQKLDQIIENLNMKIDDFGVDILQLNILSVNLCGENSKSGFASAMSSAESFQMQVKAIETAKVTKIEAESEAVARKIQAQSEAEATVIKAKADAEASIRRSEGEKAADLVRAEGSKKAATILETSKLAERLETIKTSAAAIKDGDKFFFGTEPNYMANLMKDSF